MSGSRLEKDSFGTIEVPAERLWGAQTERSRRFFRISSERMPLAVVYALALVKKAAAAVNLELGLLEKSKSEAIQRAATEVPAGRHDVHARARRKVPQVPHVLFCRAGSRRVHNAGDAVRSGPFQLVDQ